MMAKLFIAFLSFLSLKANALIGGVDVLDGDPISKSVVALQMAEQQDDGSIHFYKGSGVLIAPNAVLTAGHNFVYLKDVTASQAIFAVAPAWGSESLDQKRIGVKSVFLYPGFSQGPLGTQNDLAIVFLAESAPSDYVPLEIELNGENPPVPGEAGFLLGYGRASEGSSAPLAEYRLRRLNLKFSQWDHISILDSQKIWFSSEGGSIAGGDSGGPALFKRGSAFKIFGIGIHQRYDSCVPLKTCEPESAYSNTTFFANWINAVLNSD